MHGGLLDITLFIFWSQTYGISHLIYNLRMNFIKGGEIMMICFDLNNL